MNTPSPLEKIKDATIFFFTVQGVKIRFYFVPLQGTMRVKQSKVNLSRLDVVKIKKK